MGAEAEMVPLSEKEVRASRSSLSARAWEAAFGEPVQTPPRAALAVAGPRERGSPRRGAPGPHTPLSGRARAPQPPAPPRPFEPPPRAAVPRPPETRARPVLF